MAPTRSQVEIDHQAIQRARLSLGLSLRELAQRCGKDASQIAKYEHGTVRPYPRSLAALAKALEVEVGDLLVPAGESRQP